jgi:serine/threonine-protein kinase
MVEVGQRVGDYEVLELIGKGGMGRVYRVRNTISNRVEAMKILLPDFAADAELTARFMAEIRLLASLEHPGIAQLRTAFQYEDQFAMVMEFVEGATLEKLARKTRIPVERILDIATQSLAALSYAHGRGVTHRDIKPSNIMITTHGVVKLMDFGIAKSADDMQLTRPGITMGSVFYMSPEQVRGEAVDARSDLYSFGVTLYELLTGGAPFQADTSYSVLNAQLNEMPKPPAELNPEISPALNDIVLHAMAKQPDQRFQSAEEFSTAIKNLKGPAAPAPSASHVVAPAGWQRVEPTANVAPAVSGSSGTASAPQAAASVPPAALYPPVAVAASPQQAGTGKSRRGLWLTLGAVTALLALAAVATIAPRIFATHASQNLPLATGDSQQAPPVQPKATDFQKAASEQPSSTDTAKRADPTRRVPEKPAFASTESKSGRVADLGASPREKAARYAETAQAGSAVSESPRPDFARPAAQDSPEPGALKRAAMRDARDRYANVEARTGAVISGIDTIRSQQQAQGYGLRGNIVAAMNRMRGDMAEARRALNERDPETANEYLERAEGEVEILERFLGR